MKRHLLAAAALLPAVCLLPAGVSAQPAAPAAPNAAPNAAAKPAAPPPAATVPSPGATPPAAETAPSPAPGAAPPAAAATPHESAMLKRVDGRVADLRARLHITAAEEPQWRQFAQVMHEDAIAMERMVAERVKKYRTLTAVENMQSYAAMAQQHAENMQRLVPAFQKLYDSMPPAQKHTADAVWRDYAARRFAPHHKG